MSTTIDSIRAEEHKRALDKLNRKQRAIDKSIHTLHEAGYRTEQVYSLLMREHRRLWELKLKAGTQWLTLIEI